MSRELEPGMRVRLHTPERGYRYAEIVDFCWPRWVLRLSSDMSFPHIQINLIHINKCINC